MVDQVSLVSGTFLDLADLRLPLPKDDCAAVDAHSLAQCSVPSPGRSRSPSVAALGPSMADGHAYGKSSRGRPHRRNGAR